MNIPEIRFSPANQCESRIRGQTTVLTAPKDPITQNRDLSPIVEEKVSDPICFCGVFIGVMFALVQGQRLVVASRLFESRTRQRRLHRLKPA